MSIALSYRISPTTVGRIIRETYEALWSVLQAKGFWKVPNKQNTWKEISHRFEEMWNFLHCIGAIDGKHVVMPAPANSGSEWFNLWAFGVVVSMFDFHRSDRGSNPGRGGEFS